MTTTARAVLGAGELIFNIFNPVTQTYAGKGDPLDADKFEIKPNFEEKTSSSRSHRDYGQARASVVLPQPTEVTIELSASNAEVLAMQFQGLVSALSQGSGNFTDQDFALTALDRWLPLGKMNVSDQGFSLARSSGGGSAYTLGVHYEVNWVRGEVRFHSGVSGAPSVNDTLKLNGGYGAVSGEKILGGRVSQIRTQVFFDGMNMVNQEHVLVNVWEAVLGANNGFDFLGGDFTPVTLSGKLVTPPGKDEPYEVIKLGALA